MVKAVVSKKKQKEIANERIISLFSQADSIFSTNKSLANRYVTLARKIAMKTKVRIPVQLKRKFCKHCYKYLRSSVNSRVRTRAGKVVISCFECKKFMRIPVKK
jgi:ribonuclease P protein subunit RPR2